MLLNFVFFLRTWGLHLHVSLWPTHCVFCCNNYSVTFLFEGLGITLACLSLAWSLCVPLNVQCYWVIFSLGPGDYINMSLSGSFIVYSVKCSASVLLMFVLSSGPGDYINMSLSGSFIVYSVKCSASVLLMFVLSSGPGDYINMSLSGPLIVYSVVTIIQSHFFLRA